MERFLSYQAMFDAGIACFKECILAIGNPIRGWKQDWDAICFSSKISIFYVLDYLVPMMGILNNSHSVVHINNERFIVM